MSTEQPSPVVIPQVLPAVPQARTSSTSEFIAAINSPAIASNPESLRALLAIRKEWQADEAERAYHQAMAEFVGRCSIIPKADMAHNKEYARMDRIMRTIRPLLNELGLSVTWQVCELKTAGLVHVEGCVRHRDGHTVPVRMDIPVPELIKGQNSAQQMGSAYTYAQRYAFCAALGIVTGNDDDGNRAGTSYVTREEGDEIDTLVKELCVLEQAFAIEAFWAWAGVAESKCAYDIEAARYKQVTSILRSKIAKAKEAAK